MGKENANDNTNIIVKVLKEDKSFSPHHRCQRWSQPHKQYNAY